MNPGALEVSATAGWTERLASACCSKLAPLGRYQALQDWRQILFAFGIHAFKLIDSAPLDSRGFEWRALESRARDELGVGQTALRAETVNNRVHFRNRRKRCEIKRYEN